MKFKPKNEVFLEYDSITMQYPPKKCLPLFARDVKVLSKKWIERKHIFQEVNCCRGSPKKKNKRLAAKKNYGFGTFQARLKRPLFRLSGRRDIGVLGIWEEENLSLEFRIMVNCNQPAFRVWSLFLKTWHSPRLKL